MGVPQTFMYEGRLFVREPDVDPEDDGIYVATELTAANEAIILEATDEVTDAAMVVLRNAVRRHGFRAMPGVTERLAVRLMTTRPREALRLLRILEREFPGMYRHLLADADASADDAGGAAADPDDAWW